MSAGAYKPGTAFLKDAPWNNHGMAEYCRNCDGEQIEEMVPEEADHRDVKVEALRDQAGLCADCNDEYVADWLSDD